MAVAWVRDVVEQQGSSFRGAVGKCRKPLEEVTHEAGQVSRIMKHTRPHCPT